MNKFQLNSKKENHIEVSIEVSISRPHKNLQQLDPMANSASTGMMSKLHSMTKSRYAHEAN